MHLKDGCIEETYSTTVSPEAVRKHLGASPCLKMVAGAEATVPTRAAMVKERMVLLRTILAQEAERGGGGQRQVGGGSSAGGLTRSVGK